MKTEWKNVAKFYLGCEGKVDNLFTARMIAIHTNGNIQTDIARGEQDKWEYDRFKPILRPLSDMTEEEQGNFSFEQLIDLEDTPIEQIYFNNKQILFLLSKSFDLFNLIENVFAIDKTTIPNPASGDKQSV